MTKVPLEEKATVQLFNLDGAKAEDMDAVPSPRVVHTHMLPHLLPNDALQEGRKIVLVFRNPKDTAVSLYHFLKKENRFWTGLKISWNCFIEHWMRESCKC